MMQTMLNQPVRAVALAVVLAVVPAVTALGAPSSAAAQTRVALEHRATFHEPFGFLQSVRELPDGRLMVADPLGGLLVAIDVGSGAMNPIGREGAGPGEWRQPDAVYALPGDSTLVVDLGNTRLSVFGPGGVYVRSYPMVQTPDGGASPPRGGDAAEAARMGMRMAMQIVNPRATDAAGRIYYQGRGGLGAGGAAPDSLEVMRWDRNQAAAVRLAGLRPPVATTTTTGGARQQQVRVSGRPLAIQDDWAAAPDGSVALVRAEPYRVEWLHEDGRLVSGPPVDYRPVPVRTPEKQRWIDALGASALTVAMTVEGGSATTRMGRGGRSALSPAAQEMDDYEWPAALPPFRFGGARVDPNGRAWVERYTAVGAPVVFDVFDRRGDRIAQVTLPEGRRVIGFGRNAVFAVRVDDLGLHWLEIYAPPR